MMASITGFLGAGKTLFMVQRALLNPDKDVYCNFHIDLPNCTLVTPNDIDDVRNGILLLDEGYLWIDSRESGSKRNKSLSYEIFKSRKKKLDIWVTTQLHGAIDLRFRYLEDLQVVAMGKDRNDTYQYEFFEYYVTGFSKTKKWKISVPYAEKYLYPIYDTDEFPDENFNDEMDLNDLVTTEAETLLALYPDKLTKGMIKDYLLENKRDLNLADPIFNRIKRLTV